MAGAMIVGGILAAATLRTLQLSPGLPRAFAYVLGWLIVIALGVLAIGIIVSVAIHGSGPHPEAGTDPAIMAQLRARTERRP